jgi:hypothetical protein
MHDATLWPPTHPLKAYAPNVGEEDEFSDITALPGELFGETNANR